MSEQGDTYSVKDTAKLLNRSVSQVRRMLNQGTLAGYQDENGMWSVDQAAVHEMRRANEAGKRTAGNGLPKESELPEWARSLLVEHGRLQGQREIVAANEESLARALDEAREELAGELERRITAEARLAAYLERPKGLLGRLLR